MKLHGKTALVTGASGGIGRAIALALQARGADVILSGRRAEALEPFAAETGARTVVADLSDRAGVERLAAEAAGADVVIANAALPASGQLDDYTVEQVDRALEVNLRAPIVLAKLLLPGMVARGSGHLVFISSLAGKAPSTGGALYSATKFGVRGFALALRDDLRGSGVGVSVVFPGFIRDAGMFADSGVVLPKLSGGTRTPQDVAEGVIRAIRRDRAEVVVAPPHHRAGAAFAAVAPEAAMRAQRRLGGDRVAAALAARQRDKR